MVNKSCLVEYVCLLGGGYLFKNEVIVCGIFQGLSIFQGVKF